MNSLRQLLFVCGRELRKVVSDVGVIVFFLAVPFLYPLLYAYLYGNEVVREVPVVAVDENRTPISREFLRKSDATPDLNIVKYCSDMEEAREVLRHHKAYGIILIPRDFSSRLADGHQATVATYCDMSGLLYYKALLSGTTMVSLDMNRDMQMEKLAGLTREQLDVQTMPVENQYVTMFNPSNGFQGFIIPAILIMIIQQTMVLGVCMLAGTEYEQRKTGRLMLGGEYRNPLVVLIGRSLAYFIVYIAVCAYLLLLVPHLFHMPQLTHIWVLVKFMIPFLLSCIFFSMFLAFFVRDRESGFLLFVFVSVPLIFMSGISWPVSNMPWFWHSLAQLFPSTHGVNGFCRILSDGAVFDDLKYEYMRLWLLTGMYFLFALSAYLLFYRSRKMPGVEFIWKMRQDVRRNLKSIHNELRDIHEDLSEVRAEVKKKVRNRIKGQD